MIPLGLALMGQALAGPPAHVSLEDHAGWAAHGGLFDAAEGCWILEGEATWRDRMGAWTRAGRSRLLGRFVDGRFTTLHQEVLEVRYDTASGDRPGVFDGRPFDLQVWSQRDEGAILDDSRRARRLQRWLDRMEQSGVVTTTADWDEAERAVRFTESWPLGTRAQAARLDRTLIFPDGGPPLVEAWSLDGTRLFPGGPLTPALRLETVDVTVRRRPEAPIPAHEQVRTAVRRLQVRVSHEHEIVFGAPIPCQEPPPAP